MARKHKVITIDAECRDHGKNFLIVEKSAFDTEKWAARALLALSRSGVEVPDDAIEAGALGVLIAGIGGMQRMRYEDAEPLLEEMLTCISFVPDPNKIDPVTGRPITRPLVRSDEGGDVEEVSTLLRLRGEALDLHLGFSVTAVLSKVAAAVQTLRSPDTPTSPPSSELQSPVEKPD